VPVPLNVYLSRLCPIYRSLDLSVYRFWVPMGATVVVGFHSDRSAPDRC
jgi:hypothetical protein